MNHIRYENLTKLSIKDYFTLGHLLMLVIGISIGMVL